MSFLQLKRKLSMKRTASKQSKFQQLADLPQQYCSKPIIINDDRIIIPSDKEFIYEYIANKNEWLEFARYPDKLLLSGHSMCINKSTKQIIIYDGKGKLMKMNSNDPNNTETLDINIETKDHSLCFISFNNTFNIIGGFNNKHHYISQNGGHSFEEIATFNHIKNGMIGHCIIKLRKEKKLLMCGGWDYYDKSIFDVILQFDIDNKIWRRLDVSMPYKMCGFGYILSYDERFIVIFGGQKGDKEYLNDIYYMDLHQMEWIKSSLKCPKKSGFHAIITRNGSIHLFERVPNWKSAHYAIHIKHIIPNDDIKSNDDDTNELQRINDEQKMEIDAFNNRIQSIERELKESEESNDVLCVENESLKNEIKTSKEMYEENERNLQFEIERLNEEKKEFDKRYKELKAEYERVNTVNYMNWDHKAVLYWIINLENKRFAKYGDELSMSLSKESIDGSCLKHLDKNDLHRFGITDFKDKQSLMQHILSLILNIENNDNDHQIEGAGNSLTPCI